MQIADMGAAAAGPDRGSRRSVAWASMVRDHRLHLAVDHHPDTSRDRRSLAGPTSRKGRVHSLSSEVVAVWLRRPGARADLDILSTNLKKPTRSGIAGGTRDPIDPSAILFSRPPGILSSLRLHTGVLWTSCPFGVTLSRSAEDNLPRPPTSASRGDQGTFDMSIVQRSAAERLSGAPARPSASGGRA